MTGAYNKRIKSDNLLKFEEFCMHLGISTSVGGCLLHCLSAKHCLLLFNTKYYQTKHYFRLLAITERLLEVWILLQPTYPVWPGSFITGCLT